MQGVVPTFQVLVGHDTHRAWSSCLLGGSWGVISRDISRITMLMTHIRGLITLLISTHEPPSRREVFQTRERDAQNRPTFPDSHPQIVRAGTKPPNPNPAK